MCYGQADNHCGYVSTPDSAAGRINATTHLHYICRAVPTQAVLVLYTFDIVLIVVHPASLIVHAISYAVCNCFIMHIYIYIYMYVCLYVHTYVYMDVCIYMNMYTIIHFFT